MPKKTLYKPGQNEPFELSRSKVDLFLQCAKCFYLDRSENHRIARPGGPMSYIPTAIDLLLKKELYVELRSKELILSMVVFGLAIVLSFSFSSNA